MPAQWKIAKIKMIPKPGKNTKDSASYRPISLLSNLGKLLEKIINSRLVEYLESNNLISIHQSGFRKKRSTKDHILRLTQDIKSNFNMNNYTGAVLFDVSKAFDQTWHKGILFKMDKLKLPSYIISWVESFLMDRKFFVNTIDSNSLLLSILSGVPQGSTISPTLFTLYISDIDSKNLIIVNLALYADDICIWFSSANLKTIQSILQDAINIIVRFFKTWCLNININKTSYTIFTTAGHRKSYEKLYSISLYIVTEQITLDPFPNFLGVTFDPKVSFTNHFRNIEPKAISKINILRILKSKVGYNSKFLINIYKTLIRSLLDYSDIVITTASSSSIDILQKIQNRALRICLNPPLHTATKTLHAQANIQIVKDRANKNKMLALKIRN